MPPRETEVGVATQDILHGTGTAFGRNRLDGYTFFFADVLGQQFVEWRDS